MAVDAASEAFKTWSETSATERSIILNKIADRIEGKSTLYRCSRNRR